MIVIVYRGACMLDLYNFSIKKYIYKHDMYFIHFQLYIKNNSYGGGYIITKIKDIQDKTTLLKVLQRVKYKQFCGKIDITKKIATWVDYE